MSKKFVDPRYAKSGEYKKVLNRIAGKKICPFCPKNFKFHKSGILKKIGSWFITECGWPYTHASHHFLIIGRRHKEKIEQVSPKDFREILDLVKWARKEYKIEGGALAMRFGDTRFTGATVVHLHAHFIVPQIYPDGSVKKPVLFPIG
jgi:hypothetical protein